MLISMKDNNLFIILSASALSASFGLQGIINMASTLHLMPTKGMTLPFISYGGSSLLATALGMGMLLAITAMFIRPKRWLTNCCAAAIASN